VDKKYKGVIWTNHALARMRERGIKQGDAWATFKRPDTSKYAKTKKAYVYYKTWGSTKIEVVAKQNERKEWIVLSVWSKPAGKIRNSQKKRKSFLGLIKDIF
jgi:hypothetical protein